MNPGRSKQCSFTTIPLDIGILRVMAYHESLFDQINEGLLMHRILSISQELQGQVFMSYDAQNFHMTRRNLQALQRRWEFDTLANHEEFWCLLALYASFWTFLLSLRPLYWYQCNSLANLFLCFLVCILSLFHLQSLYACLLQ